MEILEEKLAFEKENGIPVIVKKLEDGDFDFLERILEF